MLVARSKKSRRSAGGRQHESRLPRRHRGARIMPPRQLSGCAQVSGGCRNIVSLSRTRSDFSMRKRLERLEAARQAQVCDQCAFVVKLPDDFIGDRHLVLTSSAGDGWLWFEER